MGYVSTWTSKGIAKKTNASAGGAALSFNYIVLGDGNGSPTTPDPSQPALVHEVARFAISDIGSVKVSPYNPDQLLIDVVIAAEVGGWWVREIGLVDTSGDLLAIGNCPDTFKSTTAQGAPVPMPIQFVLAESLGVAVQPVLSSDKAMATQNWVTDTINAGIATLTPTLTNLQAEISGLQTQSSQIAGNVTTLQQSVAGQAATIQTQGNSISSQGNSITGLQSTVTGLQQSVATTNQSLSAVAGNLNALKSELDTFFYNSSDDGIQTLDQLNVALDGDLSFATHIAANLAAMNTASGAVATQVSSVQSNLGTLTSTVSAQQAGIDNAYDLAQSAFQKASNVSVAANNKTATFVDPTQQPGNSLDSVADYDIITVNYSIASQNCNAWISGIGRWVIRNQGTANTNLLLYAHGTNSNPVCIPAGSSATVCALNGVIWQETNGFGSNLPIAAPVADTDAAQYGSVKTLQSSITTINGQISTLSTNLGTTNTAVGVAQNTANSAYSAANSAGVTANSALANAASAWSTANSAAVNAASAYAAANAAQNTASNVAANLTTLTSTVTTLNSKNGITAALGYTPLDAAKLGAANGAASLGADGKLLASQIPASVLGGLNYQGVWNAATNTPALTSGVGTKGYYYKVSVAGSTNIDGTTLWQVGDLIAFDGVTYDKIDGGSSEVLSFNGRVGVVTLNTTDVTSALGYTPAAQTGVASNFAVGAPQAPGDAAQNAQITTLSGQISTINGQITTINGNVANAYAAANTANNAANNAQNSATAAYTQANAAYGAANTAQNTANSAYAQANSAYAAANAAQNTANSAYSTANAAYASAGVAQTTATTANNAANSASNAAANAASNATTALSNANSAWAAANNALNVANNAAANAAAAVGSGGNASAQAGFGSDYLKSFTGGENFTVAAVNANTYNHALSGNLSANVTYVLPTIGCWLINNATTGAFTITAKTAAGTGVTLPQGKTTLVHADGNNIVYGMTGTGAAFQVGTPLGANDAAQNAQITTLTTSVGTAQSTANNAYAQANAAYGQANSASTAATGAASTANSAYSAANAASNAAANAAANASTALNNANAAYAQANAAYAQANQALSNANAAYAAANAAAASAANASAGNVAIVNGTINLTAVSTTVDSTATFTKNIKFTGTLTADSTVMMPTDGRWVLINATTGSFKLTVVTTAQNSTGVVLPAGATSEVIADGANIRLVGNGVAANFPVGNAVDGNDAVTYAQAVGYVNQQVGIATTLVASLAGWNAPGAVDLTGQGADYTLTSAVYNLGTINISGAPTANLNVVFPTYGRWIVNNVVSSGKTITAVTKSGSTITSSIVLPIGEHLLIWNDGNGLQTLNSIAGNLAIGAPQQPYDAAQNAQITTLTNAVSAVSNAASAAQNTANAAYAAANAAANVAANAGDGGPPTQTSLAIVNGANALTGNTAAGTLVAFTGALTANATVAMPDTGRWIIDNNVTMNGYTITLTGSASGSVVISNQTNTEVINISGNLQAINQSTNSMMTITPLSVAANQASWNLAYQANNLMVLLQGRALMPGDYTATDGKTIQIPGWTPSGGESLMAITWTNAASTSGYLSKGTVSANFGTGQSAVTVSWTDANATVSSMITMAPQTVNDELELQPYIFNAACTAPGVITATITVHQGIQAGTQTFNYSIG